MIFQQSLLFFDTRRSTCDALQYPEHVTFPSVAPYCRWWQWSKIFTLPRDQVKPFFRAFGFAHNFFFEPKPIKARPNLGLSSQVNITSCEIPPSRDGRTCTHYKEFSAQFVKALGTNIWTLLFYSFYHIWSCSRSSFLLSKRDFYVTADLVAPIVWLQLWLSGGQLVNLAGRIAQGGTKY